MKEVFEKIKERLEEERKVCYDKYCRYGDDYDNGSVTSYGIAIEIVNQIAEEYSSKSSSLENDGWISLPKVAFDRMIARMESESEKDWNDEEWFINVVDAARIMREIVKEYSDSENPNKSENLTSSNDGWILVSSGKLPVGEGYEYYDPEEDMTYYRQVLVHTDEVDIPYCVAYYDTDTWFCAVTGTPLVVDRWKLIEPYQPKGEK